MAEPQRYPFAKRVHAAGLRDELLAAGVAVSVVNPTPTKAGVEIDIPPAQYDQAAAIVAAHNPAPYETAEDAANQQFLADVAGLKQYQGLAAPTLAQTVLAVKAQNRILKRVVQELRDL